MFGVLPGYFSNVSPIPYNPSASQRHQLLYNSLERVGRADDYANIVSLLSPSGDITAYGEPGAFKGMTAGIVGGGLAGMSAAFQLRKLGFDVTVFEPRADRVGGRVYTYYFDKDRRLYGELGAFRIPVSHETTWHYINLFKLDTHAFIDTTINTFTYVRNVRVRNDPGGKNIQYKIYPKFSLTTKERNTPWPDLFNQPANYYLSTPPPDVRRELLMVLKQYDYRLETLMRINTRQALKQYGLSDEAINLIASILPIVGSVIYSGYSEVLVDEYTVDYENLYTISGGMSNLPLAFYNSLTNPNPVEYPGIPQDALGRVQWRGGHLVTGIYKSDVNGKVVLSYNILPSTEVIFENFDYVIMAIPMSSLRGLEMQPLFRGEKMQAIKEVLYQDAQKTLFLCNERFWEKQGIYTGASITDRAIASIFYPQDHIFCTSQTPGCSPDEPGVLVASYNIDQEALRLGMETPEPQFEFIKRDVAAVHGLPGGYLDNVVTESITVDWYKQRWIFGGYEVFLPGQRQDYLYLSSVPEYDNRVFFAGEHTSPKNAWTQGALHSGMVAANNVAFYSVNQKGQR